MKDYSEAAFFRFLDYLANKGLMKAETVRARKSSSKRLLGLLEDEEKQDLRAVDADHLAERFINIEGTGFTPESLRSYQTRFKAALHDFISYTDDPSSFRPSVSSRSTRRNGQPSRRRDGPTKPDDDVLGSSDQAGDRGDRQDPNTASNDIVFPIPIRPGRVVRIVGLPDDLTESEADKIAGVIKALATSID